MSDSLELGRPQSRTQKGGLEDRKERLYRAIERSQRFLHKNEDASELTRRIRQSYPAPISFMEANREALDRVGVSRLDAFYYAMIPALTRTVLSQQWGPKPRLDRLSTMSEYLKTLYVGVHVECFYLILLNSGGRLIRAALLQKGNVDSAPFYLRQVLSIALRENARYLVLAHNHPGGTLRPSKEDLLCTLKAINSVSALGIPLLDHIIVARDKAVSIRQTGLIQNLMWTAAAPDNRVVNLWLDAGWPC